jgi:hypothetical protein
MSDASALFCSRYRTSWRRAACKHQLGWYRFVHRYLNNPPGGSSYTIRVTATDNDTENVKGSGA